MKRKKWKGEYAVVPVLPTIQWLRVRVPSASLRKALTVVLRLHRPTLRIYTASSTGSWILIREFE